MGNPAYDARREAERAEAEKRQAEAEASTAALHALRDFMTGRAHLDISPMLPGIGQKIRVVRD